MSRPLVLVVSGANLAILGERQPEIYGTTTLDSIIDQVRKRADQHGLDVEHVQSNHDGELVDAILAARGRARALIVNPGAFTHYAWSIHDALAAFEGPVLEVHLSNPAAREPWRHTSVVSPVAAGTISGLGVVGYELAVDAIARLLDTGA
jgi:3-dehydroquinate dehydratase II